MKILMINTVSGVGSTGTICTDIAHVLENQGHDCFIAYGQGNAKYPKSYKVGAILENHLHNIGSRVLGKQGYFTKSGTKKLISFIKNYNPDIIHLHNLHGHYLNLEILFNFLSGSDIPVFWTLHDCWAFTGKCAHYTDVKCYKWQTECSKCPQLKSYPPSLFFDRSKEMFDDKKAWFTSLSNMTIIPVSKWLADQAKLSFFKNYPIKQIYNWVDHNTFQEVYDEQFSVKYNIASNKFTVLLVSAGWGSKDVKWKDALELAAMLDDSIQVIMVGEVGDISSLPKNIIHIPYLEGRAELAKAYSKADVYVHLSTEDTFGKVIAEAMSCGTPAIVYSSTACPEIIDRNCGFVVEKRNVPEVVKAINKIRRIGKSSFSRHCRERVIEQFDQSNNIRETINLYLDVI